jgi:hypothetical protein
MSLRVLLIDGSCDLHAFSECNKILYDAVICICWLALEARRLLEKKTGGKCYTLKDVIGSHEEWVRYAHFLTQVVIKEGPSYKGMSYRYYLGENVYNEFLNLKIALNTYDILSRLGDTQGADRVEVDCILSNQIGSLFESIRPLQHNTARLTIRSYPGLSSVSINLLSRLPFHKRWVGYFRETLMTGYWKARMWDAFEKVDRRYEIRKRVFSSPRNVLFKDGNITFFSSYLNNSKILKKFEGLMPQPVNWVVNNYYARLGAAQSNGHTAWLWQFSSGDKIKNEIKDYGDQSFTELTLPYADYIKASLSRSFLWKDWGSVHLPAIYILTHSWENYLKQAKPGLVAFANQMGIEGLLIHITRTYGIPTVQIMHGALSEHLITLSPMLSDVLIVPGEFWRTLWPEDQRHKIVVYNPQGQFLRVKRQKSSKARHLTFFSWPLAKIPTYDFSEFTDGFIHIFQKLISKKGVEITVRAHPAENPSDFTRRWKQLYGTLPPGLHIHKHEPLAHTLSSTDVALMFRSTVMLDCMINNIPFIMPGWIDFGWNHALENIPGVCLAPDFQNLEDRLIEWLENPPELSRDLTEYFVRAPGEGKEAFSQTVENLLTR